MFKFKGYICGKGEVVEVEGDVTYAGSNFFLNFGGVEPEIDDVITLVIRL